MISTRLNAFQHPLSTPLNAVQRTGSTDFNPFQRHKISSPTLSCLIVHLCQRICQVSAYRSGGKCSKLCVDESRHHQRRPAGETKTLRRRTRLPQPPRTVRGFYPRTTPAAQNVAGNCRRALRRKELRHHRAGRSSVLPAASATSRQGKLGGCGKSIRITVSPSKRSGQSDAISSIAIGEASPFQTSERLNQ